MVSSPKLIFAKFTSATIINRAGSCTHFSIRARTFLVRPKTQRKLNIIELINVTKQIVTADALRLRTASLAVFINLFFFFDSNERPANLRVSAAVTDWIADIYGNAFSHRSQSCRDCGGFQIRWQLLTLAEDSTRGNSRKPKNDNPAKCHGCSFLLIVLASLIVCSIMCT